MEKYVIDCSAVEIGSYCFGKSHTIKGYRRTNMAGNDEMMYNLRDVCNLLRIGFTPDFTQCVEQYVYIKDDAGRLIEYGNAISAARIAASCKDKKLRNKFFDFLWVWSHVKHAA